MNITENIIKYTDINILIYMIKNICISVSSYYIGFRILNIKDKINNKMQYVYVIFGAIFCSILKYQIDSFVAIFFLVVLLTIIFSKFAKLNFWYALFINIISLSLNYIIFFIAILISFVPNTLLKNQNDYINLFLIIIIYFILEYFWLKIKRFKNGFAFLQKKFENEIINILIINVSVIIYFTFIILTSYNVQLTMKLTIAFIIFSIIMFITIQKSLQLYYKQKLLEQELDETKEELEKKKEEVKQLEAENLNFSKTSHSLAHKQKSLEYKLEQLKQKYEIAKEIELEDRIKEISKELYNKTPEVELSKTGITEIDDMLKYMQSECIKNKIDFKLQIKGNIYEMINNYVSKEDLTILLADHIKNAIIAIKYSENINKTILVRLGKIDKIYSLYIYDSGIEFEKETLSNLGKKPSTTHADSGGTGMGFMNTFDTLKKYNASLIINEYNKPCKDNYTKSIMIKFDKKQEFKINSYR